MDNYCFDVCACNLMYLLLLLIALSRGRRKSIHVSFACAIPQRIQFMVYTWLPGISNVYCLNIYVQNYRPTQEQTNIILDRLQKHFF